MSRKALVVEDHEDLAKLVAQHLGNHVDHVDIALDGESGREFAMSSRYALIVLDVMLPKLSGIKVCESLRASGVTSPILLATGRADQLPHAMGARNGADDYVLKPFDLTALEEKAKRLIEHPRPKLHGHGGRSPEQTLQIGGLLLDPKMNKVVIDGKPVRGISAREFELLYFLGKHVGFPCSKRDMLAEVWGVTAAIGFDRSGIDLRRLQEKLEPNPGMPRFLRMTGDGRAAISDSRFL